MAAGTHTFFFRKLRRTHRSYFRNYVRYIVSIFALAEITKKKKCINRGFSQLFKIKYFISIGPVVFGQEIKKVVVFSLGKKCRDK